MTIIEKLSAIQQEIKAPKSLYNKFGNYYYRNAEGILEAFKPFEAKYDVVLVISDEVVQIGERYYVRAEATISDTDEPRDYVTATAYAREAETKKGMDDSQITGTASSYARKYALNGLLLLDDTKDADTDEYHEQVKKDLVSDQMVKTLEECIPKHGQTVTAVCKSRKVKKLEDLTVDQFRSLMDAMGENK